MSGVNNAVTELRFAEQPSFAASVAQDSFCDAENDDETDDNEDCGVIHAPMSTICFATRQEICFKICCTLM